jgi:hypothetical protein
MSNRNIRGIPIKMAGIKVHAADDGVWIVFYGRDKSTRLNVSRIAHRSPVLDQWCQDRIRQAALRDEEGELTSEGKCERYAARKARKHARSAAKRAANAGVSSEQDQDTRQDHR